MEKKLDDRLRVIMDKFKAYRNQVYLEEQYREKASKDKKSMEKLSDWERNFGGLEEKEREIGKELTVYMKDVAKAYRLPTQIGSVREITVGSFEGANMPFAPKVIFDDIYINAKPDPRDPKKTLTYARDYRESRAAASTIANGDIVFRAAAFEWKGRAKAGIVASYLYHESVHYRHFTTEKKPFKREWSEALAYTAVANFQDSVFMLDADFKRENAQMAAENLRLIAEDKRAKELWRQNAGLLRGQKIPTPEPDKLTDAVQDDDDWRVLGARALELGKIPKSIKKGQADLAERVREEREERGNFDWRVQAEVNERMGLPPPPPPGGSSSSGSTGGCPGRGPSNLPSPCLPTVTPAPRAVQPRYAPPPAPIIVAPAQPARPAEIWTGNQLLNALAEKGCADAWPLSQADLDWYWNRILGSDRGKAVPLGLQGCQLRLYQSLSDMAAQGVPARITQEIFARTAEAARNSSSVTVTDEFPDIPGQQWPEIPTCRHHDWCKNHELNRHNQRR